MRTNLSLTVIILAYNEDQHIGRCLDSLEKLGARVVVVDCFSTDKTKEISLSKGAEVLHNKWVNHAVQFNWALAHANIDSDWVMRLDADEVVSVELSHSLMNKLPCLDMKVSGLTVNRQIHFMGTWIKHGDIYPRRMLRVWRNGQGQCENRWMDEHIIVIGEVKHINGDIADINLNNITWWIDKHNHYATREAIDILLSASQQNEDSKAVPSSMQARVNRWFKHKVYARIPFGFRSFLYFIYRYVFRLGFLDGWSGLIFHFLQGYWYRFLVDVKVWEIRRMMKDRNQSLEQVALSEYNYELK